MLLWADGLPLACFLTRRWQAWHPALSKSSLSRCSCYCREGWLLELLPPRWSLPPDLCCCCCAACCCLLIRCDAAEAGVE